MKSQATPSRFLIVAAGFVAFAGAAEVSRADTIVAEFTTVLRYQLGFDSFGLDGATVTIETVFDADAEYANFGGQVGLLALSHTITVSGATVPGSNGSFMNPDGMLYLPSFLNQFRSADGSQLEGGPFSVISMATPGPGSTVPGIGDQVQLTDFNTGSYGPSGTQYVASDNSAAYGWVEDASFSVTLVPAPGVLSLLGLGGVCASRRRR